jgi:hypothetical protein
MAWIGLKHWMLWMLTAMHPFFISVVEIEHNAKEASIEISVRTYTDDLEKMIQKEFNVKLDLSQANQKEKADAYIQQYLQKKLALRANGVSTKMDFVGYEVQKESTWSYFEIKQVKQLKQLNVFCEILFGVDPNQINIIHVNSGGQRKSYELATPKNTTQFNF